MIRKHPKEDRAERKKTSSREKADVKKIDNMSKGEKKGMKCSKKSGKGKY